MVSVYVDSSALVKLVLAEAESGALRTWLNAPIVATTCALARTEVIRAVAPGGEAAIARSRELLRSVEMIALDDSLLDAAAVIGPATLRSLDAIHLAASLALGDDLLAVVTYDRRMLAGARALGLPTATPGSAETLEG